jgi:hypothetical protein
MGAEPPLRQTFHLAVLLEQARRMKSQAQIMVDRAKAACAAAADLAGASQGYREERKAWDALLARLPSVPSRLVVLCASCHRIRGVDGWTPLPVGIEAELLAWRGAMVSHGYCPDCLQSQFLPPEKTP